MIVWIDVVRLLHVLGACVLIGTGAGIAFFMVMAHRTRDAASIAHTAHIVVIADMLFTATAAVAQPITGFVLARYYGWPLWEGWIAVSLALYVFIGLFWLPVVSIQIKMRDEARTSAQTATPLSARYMLLYRIWFACGVPAFLAIVALLWLMVVRPAI
ncbi:conserved hypothetical conserved membrane protein [Ruegeria sp. TM1040]|jgi:uncharacterized membrane protein|uniref:DUF2269 family protein n=1 Tax=Ruegeria sp. (strain TM1040) TaxID=292414 RepID=UPI0000462F72|nr:DUF2269 domain-containing protein [Ruegeria sp. TM1040]ABF64809.1 conserved hypothetical conserved membrane protein [Ruegeria sp. TM1040]MDF9303380.1 DUF2269 domain-containing protein [Tritonibacter mobilis]